MADVESITLVLGISWLTAGYIAGVRKIRRATPQTLHVLLMQPKWSAIAALAFGSLLWPFVGELG